MGRPNRILQFLTAAGGGLFGLMTLATFVLLQVRASAWAPRQIPLLFASLYFHAGVTALFTIAWLAARRLSLKTLWLPRGLMVLFFPLTAASLDLTLGIFYPPATIEDSIYTPNVRRGWFHRVSAEGFTDNAVEPVRTNRLGLRGEQPPAVRSADELRVFFVGDSVTFGVRLPEAKTLPVQTAEALRSRLPGRSITCLNGGVVGYATWQSHDLLVELFDAVQPDVVVHTFCINDVSDVRNVTGRRVTAAPLANMATGSGHWSGAVRCLDALIVQPRLERWRDWNLWGTPISERDRDDPYFNESVLYTAPLRDDIARAWDRVREDLTQMADFCRQRKRPLLVAYMPFERQLAAAEPIVLPQRMLGDWAAGRRVAFIDLSIPLRAAAQSAAGGASAIMMDSVHPNAAGHELASRAIADAIVKLNGPAPGVEP